MNARIRELAERAGFYFYDMHDVDGQDLGETIEADSWVAAEKFTELIIKECVQYLNGEIDRLCEYQNSLPELDQNRRDDVSIVIEKCMDNIQGFKEYFGVKE